MLSITPGVPAGIALQGADTHLGESWIQWGGGGSPPGNPFLWYGSTLFSSSSKGPSGEDTQAYPLPQVNSATGPSQFPSPNGSLYTTKGWGPAGPFCTRCLSMGDFRLSSQFKKLYVYIASMVKSLGDISWAQWWKLMNITKIVHSAGQELISYCSPKYGEFWIMMTPYKTTSLGGSVLSKRTS